MVRLTEIDRLTKNQESSPSGVNFRVVRSSEQRDRTFRPEGYFSASLSMFWVIKTRFYISQTRLDRSIEMDMMVFFGFRFRHSTWEPCKALVAK